MNLKDKVVIVTGSARGLGQAYAVRFAQEKARVVVCDVTDCAETVRQIETMGAQVLSLKTDVANEASTVEMANKTMERFGRIDILVNNAGLTVGAVEKGKRKPFYEISAENWDKMMGVNLKGMFLCCKAVFPFMKQQEKGKIVNIASSLAFSALPLFTHYTASKGGVIALTRSIAREAGEYNITVNAVAPGLIMTKEMETTISQEFRQLNIQQRCLKREGRPEDMLGVIMFLSSEESDFITGQTILIDGGMNFH